MKDKEIIESLVEYIDCLDIYITDDDRYEMEEETDPIAQKRWAMAYYVAKNFKEETNK